MFKKICQSKNQTQHHSEFFFCCMNLFLLYLCLTDHQSWIKSGKSYSVNEFFFNKLEKAAGVSLATFPFVKVRADEWGRAHGVRCGIAVCSHPLHSCGAFLFYALFLFAVVVWVGGLGLLGELWSSILSGCLMDRAASTDNVKGCERGRWWFLCQTGRRRMKLRDYSLRHLLKKGKLKKKGKKNPGKQFVLVTWFTLRSCICLSASCSFSALFSLFFFSSTLKHTVGALRRFFAKSLWQG